MKPTRPRICASFDSIRLALYKTWKLCNLLKAGDGALVCSPFQWRTNFERHHPTLRCDAAAFINPPFSSSLSASFAEWIAFSKTDLTPYCNRMAPKPATTETEVIPEHVLKAREQLKARMGNGVRLTPLSFCDALVTLLFLFFLELTRPLF